ncbi:hypothetical protein NAEGRDRAFT_56563 [Naegleria gruberi]|uniref:Uncharacterized protein n=1 Tax=Naegleria gruberi TaxID=5762 RepID=D2UX74_NAEGR|nr:uncharacterized protein NAEGRDRAFT_56563 [Naegleria gruberi]EFC50879.1 hypothetical protein NAEGRDRAFT_56563 [Naegleria gruberi]|eukprot:XP_002683623.1 hypothetical protein NAEGRDRAFT_56563 [Naegleria gruberi strain NEG-M]
MGRNMQRGLLRRGKNRKELEKSRKAASTKKAQRLENIGIMASKDVDESARVYEEQFEKGLNKPIKGREDRYVSNKNKAIMDFIAQSKNAPPASTTTTNNASTTKKRRLNIDNGNGPIVEKSAKQRKVEKNTSAVFASNVEVVTSTDGSTVTNRSTTATANSVNNGSSDDGTVRRQNAGKSMNVFTNTRGALVTAIKTGNLDLVPESLKGLSTLPNETTKAKLKKKVYFKMKKEKEALKKLKKKLAQETALDKSKVKKHKMKNAKFEDLDEFLDEKEYGKNERKRNETLLSLGKDEVADEVGYDSEDLMEEKRDEVAFGEVAQEPPRLSKLRGNLEKKIKEKKEEDIALEKQREAERQRVVENYNRNKLIRQQQKESGVAPTEQKQMLEKLKMLATLRGMENE